jgi:carbon-monoxide dehydrogenase small subunit
VQTVETLAAPDVPAHLHPLVDCFDRVGGGQCGFCTPGMLMSTTALLERSACPTRDEIKIAISGNLCRCTGYGRIVDAVEMAARLRRGEAPGGPDVPGVEHVPPPLPSNTRKAQKERG